MRARTEAFRGRPACVALAVLSGLVATGCAKSTDTTTSTSTSYMVLTMTVTPNPASAVTSNVEGYAWTTSFTVTVAESGGVAGTIYSVQASLNEASGGIEVVTDKEVEQVQVGATSSTLAANGSVNIPITINYTLPGGGREAVVDVVVVVAGSDGYAYQVSGRFSVV
jgi:hypothetical protein